MLHSLFAISTGAALGAVSRWLLGLALNPVFPAFPLGTLAVNLVGGYIIGFAVSFFMVFSTAAEWRLFVITGFLGSLTTFSTFSAEVVTMIQQGHFVLAGGTVFLHVCGSLLMTFLGIGSFALLQHLLR